MQEGNRVISEVDFQNLLPAPELADVQDPVYNAGTPSVSPPKCCEERMLCCLKNGNEGSPCLWSAPPAAPPAGVLALPPGKEEASFTLGLIS